MVGRSLSPASVRRRSRRRRRLARRVRISLTVGSLICLAWSSWTLISWTSETSGQHVANEVDTDSNFRLAKGLLTSGEAISQEKLEKALDHLRATVETDPSHGAAQAMLAELLVKLGRRGEALKQLHDAVNHDESLRIVLATLCESTGQPLAAREHAQLVIERYRTRAVADLTDVDARLQWAQAELLLGNYDMVEMILERGRTAVSDPRYQEVGVDLFLKKAVRFQSEVSASLDALERALEMDPSHTYALHLLGQHLSKGDKAHHPRILKQLEMLERRPGAALMVYQLLSGYHCHQEAWVKARALCEKGLQEHPQAHVLMNNLAWALAHGDSADLPQALALVNEAVEGAEAHPIRLEYLATRGILYGLSSEWTRAIADLEQAVKHLPGRQELRVQLAESYSQAGRPELAASLLKSDDEQDL